MDRHVADKTIEALNEFFHASITSNPASASDSLLAVNLRARQEHLQNYVWSQPKNVEIRERLIGLGYSEELFKSNLMCSVQIDDKENILEKFKLSMRLVYLIPLFLR